MRRPSEATHSELEAAWVASAKPFVRAITVARVVESLISGEIGPIEVQMWAALLKHGYLGRSGAPIRPVDFPYEPEFEEEISSDWGGLANDDILRSVDAAEKLPFVEPGRTCAAGASYGGYMIDWIAGHIDRFRCLSPDA